MAADWLFLLEGPDDRHFVGQLLRLFGYEDDLYKLRECEGYEQLRTVLSVQLKASEPTGSGCLAIVVDADSHPNRRWQSLRDVLLVGGYAAPESADPTGTVIDTRPEGRPVVGVWMWPDNHSPGMLEDFVAQMIRQSDSTWPHARNCVDAIDIEAAPEEERLFKPVHRTKAYVHTWLAWREPAGRPMGHAVKLGLLDSNAACVGDFRQWIARLYPALSQQGY